MAQGSPLGMTFHDQHGSERDLGQEVESTGERRGTGVSRWSLLLLLLAITLAVVLGQNTERVRVEVLWASFEAPLFLVVLLTALGLTLLWELATLVLRHRRRRARPA
jgi:uncharacterized integral membrane protein